MKQIALSIVSIAVLLAPALSQATLQMTVNTADKTLTFGATTDTGAPSGPTNFLAEWQANATFSGSLNQSFSLNSVLLTDGAPPNNAELEANADVGYIAITVLDPSDYSTITGTGTSVSYASLDATLQASLEALAASNTSIPLTFGSGFEPIATTTVPEPSNYGLLAALGSLTLLPFVRRRP